MGDFTEEQLIEGARRAYAAGNVEAAQRLIAQARSVGGGSGIPVAPQGGVSVNREAANDLSLQSRSALHGVGNGMSFGFGDNIAAGMDGVGAVLGGGEFGPAYSESLGNIQQADATIRDYAPAATATGDITGSLIPALASAPLAVGKGLLGTAGRSMTIGGIEGGLHGAGNANGEDTLGKALTGAGIGAGIGLAAPVAIGAGGALRNGIGNTINAARGTASRRAADRAIAKTVQESGAVPDEIMANMLRAVHQGQPEYRLMDALGVAGQRRASGVARSGGDAATELTEFLSTRQLDQGDRVAGFVDDAFGTRGTTAAQTRDGLTAARGAAADTNYAAARGNAAPVDVRGALGVIDTRLGPLEDAAGTGFRGDGIDARLSQYRNRLAADRVPDDIDAMELSDFDRVLGVKQDLQDDIGAATRAGRNNEARVLGQLATQLDEALEASSDGYRVANDSFRDASRTIDAIDDGAGMATRGRGADNAATFNAMNPDQQGAARIGYGDNLLGKLENVAAPTANRARPLRTTRRATEADAIAIDSPLYRDRLARENEMWETQNRALGGSRTADNQADQNALSELAGGTIDAAQSAANFQVGDAVRKIGRLLSPITSGDNSATRQLIAKALMSSDPSAALQPALRRDMVGKNTSRVLEAMLRQPMQAGLRE